jgi:uncharacterized protein (UPF0332 family)
VSLTVKERDVLVKNRIEKALLTVADVEFLLDNSMLHLAINRVYYSAFYVLSALALQHHFSTAKHQQLIGWFNKNFIKNGKLDIKYGQFVHKAYDKRSKGDYDDFAKFEKREVAEMLEELKGLIAAIKKIIINKQS